MTSEELVKSMLDADTCELYDKVRINNLLKNATQGFGKVNVTSEYVVITHTFSKTKRLTYNIPKLLLTKEQLDKL